MLSGVCLVYLVHLVCLVDCLEGKAKGLFPQFPIFLTSELPNFSLLVLLVCLGRR